MKIVHCVFSFGIGGAETMLIDILNEQSKTETVSLVIVNHVYLDFLLEQINPAVRIFKLRRQKGSYSPVPVLKLNWLLYRLNPDVIHVHSSALLRIIALRAGRGLFLTVHDLHIPLEHAGRGTQLIAISEAVKTDIQQRTGRVAMTIPNGIPMDKIEKRTRRASFVGKNMRIVQVSRLDVEKKGQDILIKAVALLKERGIENIEVDFIGEGRSEPRLRQLVQEYCVGNQINFLGLCDRQYIYSHLKEYDLMCHPARYEGFGLTVAEGIAAMLPVLVSDEGGPYEIIKYGELGYAFRMEDVTDCANQIEYIYNNYDKAMERAGSAYTYVAEQFSVRRMVADYIKAYQNP